MSLRIVKEEVVKLIQTYNFLNFNLDWELYVVVKSTVGDFLKTICPPQKT